MIAGRIIPAIATTTASVTGVVVMEMLKVLQRKPVEKLRNGNYSLGTNAYMMFEANPPSRKVDGVVIDMPNPEEHPDAYDAGGKLQDMYKDPDMGLGFAERQLFHPSPHTKYDKFWVDDAGDMTVKQLIDAVNALFADANLKVSMIGSPPVRVERTPTPDDPSTARSACKMLWSIRKRYESLSNSRLDKKWVPLLRELTTRSDDLLSLDDPIDVSGKLLYSDLGISLENEDGDDVTSAPIVLKLGDFDFVPYADRVAKAPTPWL